MEESTEDLIKYFKSKVEEAISLLPKIPETQRHEVWTYWQIISVAVKAAVGGKGQIISDGTKLRATKGRPRGRPRLCDPQRKLLSGKNKSCTMVVKEDVQEKVTPTLPSEAEGNKANREHQNADDKDLLEPLVAAQPSECTENSVTINADCVEDSNQPTVPQIPNHKDAKEEKHFPVQETVTKPVSSEITRITTEDTTSETFSDQEIVVKVSRGGSSNNAPQVDFVSVPNRTSANEIPCTPEKAVTVQSSVAIDVEATTEIPVSELQIAVPPLSVPPIVKRKRGRPPKSAAKLSHVPATSSSAEKKTKGIVPSTVGSETKTAEGSALNADRAGIRERTMQKDLQSIITALQLEKKKETDVSEAAPPAPKVRRSERRSAPNRDKLFCYFDQKQEDEVEELQEVVEEEVEKVEETEKEEPTVVNIAENLEADVKEEKEEVEEKTEDEKVQERTCQKCNAVLMSASSMAAHMRIHTGERPFACPVCHKTFTTKGNCERHEVTHVGLKAFTCTQCNKKFTEKKSLKIHMRRHTGERPYACSVCGLRFFQTGTLKTHMDRHTGRKSHLCELCGKAFRQSCQLRVHMRRHTKDMAFSCQNCSKRFYTKSDMERHELKHTGERPFACDKCSETFTRQQYLREHQNTHLGRRPYKCVICSMSFYDFASCHRHVNKHKVPVDGQPAQQIQVEVPADTPSQQVMEQVQVILDQQNLTGYQAAEIQTLIIPEHHGHVISTGATATTTTTPGQSSTNTILRNLVLNVDDSAEIYHVTLVESGPDVTVSTDNSTVQSVSSADFSAMNLLASATTQLSLPQ